MSGAQLSVYPTVPNGAILYYNIYFDKLKDEQIAISYFSIQKNIGVYKQQVALET